MKAFSFLKRFQLNKLLTMVFAVAVLFVTTACNSGNEVGARPNNPPVQAGGQNNPHKMGGDGYTEYQTDPAPAVKGSSDRASLTSDSNLLVAVNVAQGDGLLYPGSKSAKSAKSVDDFVSPDEQERLMDPGEFPAPRQPVIDRSDPNSRILEKVGQAFKDASGFLDDKNVVEEPAHQPLR